MNDIPLLGDYRKFINIAFKRQTGTEFFVLGKLPEKIILKINEITNLSIDELSKYELVVQEHELRHSFKKHSQLNEYMRGQIPLILNDFELLPMILSNPDKIELGEPSKTHQG